MILDFTGNTITLYCSKASKVLVQVRVCLVFTSLLLLEPLPVPNRVTKSKVVNIESVL